MSERPIDAPLTDAGIALYIRESVLPTRDDYQAELSRLTPSETDVLRLTARGFTVKEVAQRFKVQPDTIKKHRASITSKLGVNICGACWLAGAAGWT
jgi:DNA-binding CsgD family transcriptional regulator